MKYHNHDDAVKFNKGIQLKFDWHWIITRKMNEDKFQGHSYKNDYVRDIYIRLKPKSQMDWSKLYKELDYRHYVRHEIFNAKQRSISPLETVQLGNNEWGYHEFTFEENEETTYREYFLFIKEDVISCLINYPTRIQTPKDFKKELSRIEKTLAEIQVPPLKTGIPTTKEINEEIQRNN